MTNVGLFVPLDVEYPSDPKILRAGAWAELLYVRGLCLAKRLLTDGRIEAAHLPGLTQGIPGKPAKHVDALVREGLWSPADAEVWTIVAWSSRNPSRAKVEEKREAKREAGIKGNHDRWHNEKPSPECRYCIASASQDRSQPDRTANPNRSPETESKPETKTESSSSGPACDTTLDPEPMDDDPRIGEALTLLAQADLEARLTAAPDDPIGDPDRWVAAAVRRRCAAGDDARLRLRLRDVPALTAFGLAISLRPVAPPSPAESSVRASLALMARNREHLADEPARMDNDQGVEAARALRGQLHPGPEAA